VFLNAIYRAVTTSPVWSRTVLVFNFDEWGGFFEHVPPPTAPIPPADKLAGNTDGLLGFRVPCLLVSPFAPRERVSHVVCDHTSILRMIEWRWNLPPLTVPDATANNLATALDFRAPSHVVIGLGGIAGVGEKKVVVPWSDLKLAPVAAGKKNAVTMDAAKLESAPRYDRAAAAHLDAAPAASPRLPSGAKDTDRDGKSDRTDKAPLDPYKK
jgi:hypothetical protein